MEINVVVLNSVKSTLEEAKMIKNAAEGTVVLAREQTGCRGRIGKRWYSPAGGLWFTIITQPNVSSTTSPMLSLSTALAVAKGISKTTGLNATVRWPNDVYVHGGKVGGVLTEMKVENDIITQALVSICINANFDIDALPDEIRTTATTLKREAQNEIDLERLFSNTIDEFSRLYEYYKTGWLEYLVGEIKESMEFIGAPVNVMLHSETLIGILTDIDILGRIALKLDTDIIYISPGDVRSISPL